MNRKVTNLRINKQREKNISPGLRGEKTIPVHLHPSMKKNYEMSEFWNVQ